MTSAFALTIPASVPRLSALIPSRYARPVGESKRCCSPRRQQRTKVPGPFRRPELPQGLGFDLADTFSRDVEFLADLFERMLPLAADAETQADHLLFLGRKCLEDVDGFVAHIAVDHRINGRAYPAVFDQIAERGFAIAADRRFKRHGVARDGFQL